MKATANKIGNITDKTSIKLKIKAIFVERLMLNKELKKVIN